MLLPPPLPPHKVVFEKTKDTVHASHAEVLEAVQESGKNVEAIVKKVLSKEVIGKYLEALPTVMYKSSGAGVGSKSGGESESDSSAGNVIVTIVGLAALVGGLYIVMKNRK